MAAVVHPRLETSWDGTGLGLVRPDGAPPYVLRRLAAALALVLVVLLATSAVRLAVTTIGAGAGPSPPALPLVLPAGPPPVAPAHVVAAGDSYWSIAVSLRPDGDVRALVDQLVERNGGRPLQPGDRVVLPLP